MRAKVALRNLYISQTIILFFLVYAYFVWFPHSFSELGGFKKTAFMLVFVDIVLGPLLVYIIFKEGKKHLKFDINVLLGIQIIAFVFGAYSLFLKHPAYAVFTGDRFTLVNVSHIHPRVSLAEQIKSSFFSSTKLVIAKMPENLKEKNELVLGVLLQGEPDIDRRPNLYKPYENHTEDVFNKQLKPHQVFIDPSSIAKLTRFLKENGGKESDYAFFPLRGNNQRDVIWAFSVEIKTPIGIIDSDPWASNSAKVVKSENRNKGLSTESL